MRALHECVDAPVSTVDMDGCVTGRERHRKPEPRPRPVNEDAVAIPDLRHELRHTVPARCRARIEARLASTQQIIDARGVRELLQLEVEELTDFVARRYVGCAARENADRGKSGQQRKQERAPDGLHARA